MSLGRPIDSSISGRNMPKFVEKKVRKGFQVDMQGLLSRGDEEASTSTSKRGHLLAVNVKVLDYSPLLPISTNLFRPLLID